MSISRNPHLKPHTQTKLIVTKLLPEVYEHILTFSVNSTSTLFSELFEAATTKKNSNILPCSYFLFPKTSLQLLAIPKLLWLRFVFKVNYFLKIILLSKLKHYANVESLTLYKHLQPKFTAMNNIYSYIIYNFKKKLLYAWLISGKS